MAKSVIGVIGVAISAGVVTDASVTVKMGSCSGVALYHQWKPSGSAPPPGADTTPALFVVPSETSSVPICVLSQPTSGSVSAVSNPSREKVGAATGETALRARTAPAATKHVKKP